MSEAKVFLITGASTGIGAATARQAVAAGHHVVLTARSDDKLETLVSELGNDHALAVPCDVSSWGDQKRAVAETITHFGRLDVAFANAGVSLGGSFLGGDDTPDAWRKMILTNVFGVALTARAVLPELVKTKGQFIITGSVAGRITPPGNLYAATKWAVTGLGESIRKEVTPHGVRVMVLAPGRVETPMWGEKPKDFPMLSADDVANAVLYAISQPPHVDINELIVRPVGQER